MTQIKELIKSTNDTLVFNIDTWNLVKSFIEKRYSEYSILIVTVDEDEIEFDNFDNAYIYITDNQETVCSIRTNGVNTENDYTAKVVIWNNLKRSYSRPTVLVNIEYNDNNADAVDAFAESLFAQTRNPNENWKKSFRYEQAISFFYSLAIINIAIPHIKASYELSSILMITIVVIMLGIYFLISKTAEMLKIDTLNLPDLLFMSNDTYNQIHKKYIRKRRIIGIPLTALGIGLLAAPLIFCS